MNQSELDLIKEYLAYDPSSPSGLVWIKRPANKVIIGSVAGSISHGYYQLRFKGCRFLSHRLVYQLSNNTLIPDKIAIDHIDRNPGNNTISNLRLDPDNKNQGNVGIRINNTSGFPGVHFEKPSQKWIASIWLKDWRLCLGRFPDPESAFEVYKDYHYRHFKEFSPYKPIPAL